MIERIDKALINKAEQETSIVIDPVTKTATLYTCVPTMIKTAYNLAENSEVKILSDDQYGIQIELPSRWVKVTRPRKVEYTDEQREAMKVRLSEARKKKEEKKDEPCT